MTRTEQRELTLKEYAEGWRQRIERSTLKPSAKKDYLGQLDHLLPDFGHLPMSYFDSDAEDDQFDFQQRLESFVDHKLTDKAPRTVKKMLQCLHRILEEARERLILKRNTMDGKVKQFHLDRDKDPTEERVRAMTEEQLDTFLKAARWAQPDYFHLWYFLARTGCRTGEALALEWSDFDLPRKRAHISKKLWMPGSIETAELVAPKTKYSERFVTLSSGLCDSLYELHDLREEQAAAWGVPFPAVVFCGHKGKSRGTYRSITDLPVRMATVLERAGLPKFLPHDLRHTYATQRINRGHNIKEISRELGHADVSITLNVYGKWLRNVDHAAVDSLDTIFSRKRNREYHQPLQQVTAHP